jgi:hypothetical protein
MTVLILIIVVSIFFSIRFVLKIQAEKAYSVLHSLFASDVETFHKLLNHIESLGFQVKQLESQEVGYFETRDGKIYIHIPSEIASLYNYIEAYLLWGCAEIHSKFDRTNLRLKIIMFGSLCRTIGFFGTFAAELTRFVPDSFTDFCLPLYVFGILLGTINFAFFTSATVFAIGKLQHDAQVPPQIQSLIYRSHGASLLGFLVEAVNPAPFLTFFIEEWRAGRL